MGGLKKFMPVTFATYAIGMMALSGVPILFSGFWSKDAILHAAHDWPVSRIPFYLGVSGALLTAFYMTRQMCYVFFGNNRADSHYATKPHESPRVMTIPLAILAVFAIMLGFIGTPAWPWFQSYLSGEQPVFNFAELWQGEVRSILLLSTVIVAVGIGLGWWFYGRKPITSPDAEDVLERLRPDIYELFRNKFYIDELYEATVIRFFAWWAQLCDAMDYWVWNGAVVAVSYLILALAWVNRLIDEYAVNLGFDEGCKGVAEGGKLFSRLQNGRVQSYLRVIGVALTVLILVLIWGCRPS
jgi:NADH-quinone oxidoreductase subunit L